VYCSFVQSWMCTARLCSLASMPHVYCCTCALHPFRMCTAAHVQRHRICFAQGYRVFKRALCAAEHAQRSRVHALQAHPEEALPCHLHHQLQRLMLQGLSCSCKNPPSVDGLPQKEGMPAHITRVHVTCMMHTTRLTHDALDHMHRWCAASCPLLPRPCPAAALQMRGPP